MQARHENEPAGQNGQRGQEQMWMQLIKQLWRKINQGRAQNRSGAHERLANR